MAKENLGAERVDDGWRLRLPKGKTVLLTEEQAWALGRDLWAKRVHLDPRLRGSSTAGPSVLEVIERQLDEVVDKYDQVAVQPLESITEVLGQLRGAVYGLAWAVAAIRVPYSEDRRADALEEERRSRSRVQHLVYNHEK